MPQTAFYTLRRPLIGVALAVVAGMVTAASGLVSCGTLFVAALGGIVLGGLLFRNKIPVLLVYYSVALVSACRFMVAATPLSDAEINRLQPQLPIDDVQLIGRVSAPPQYHPYRSGKHGTWVFPLECEGIKAESPCGCRHTPKLLPPTTTNHQPINQPGRDRPPGCPQACSGNHARQANGACGALGDRALPTPPTTTNHQPINQPPAWHSQRGRIQVRVTGAPPDAPFRQGARIRFSGALRRRTFPGGEPIELVVPASGDWEILSAPPRFSPLIWGQRMRETAARTLSNGIEEQAGQLAVYKALLLGYRKAVPSEIYQQFKRTGTLHIFAISGLHVGIVGLLITLVLKTVGIPRDRWGLILLPLLLGYVVATGMKSSALRALTMAAVFFLAPLFRRQPDIPVSIAFAAILLLFWKPLEICSAGFILSFTVVSFIVMLFAAVPKEFIFRGRGWGRAVRTYLLSLAITSVAAFIASAPLTALFFGSFAPLSLVGNLIVVPLTFCIVLSGWLSILIPAASTVFNHAALVFINGLLGTTGWLSRLPAALGTIPPPPLTALLFWYGGWIHLFTHAQTKRQRSASCILITLAVALSLLK